MSGTIAAAAIMLLLVAAAALGAELNVIVQPPVGLMAIIESRQIVDARAPPYAAVGRFIGAVACTAALVLHPKIIVTAAHCVTDRNDKLNRMKWPFQLGYKYGADPGQFQATIWAVGSLRQYNRPTARDVANDWAILVLETAPTAVRPLSLSDDTSDILGSLSSPILMPGYSSDVAAERALSVDPACSIRGVAWNILLHNCRASFGSSGAPLLVRDGDWYTVIGVHSGSILIGDMEHRDMRPLGSATGAWAFSKALHEIHGQLILEDARDGRPTY